jgi:hypothetical protein
MNQILQSEAEALLLAARISSILQLQVPTFLTNQNTVAAAAVPALSNSHVPWKIRKHI